MLIFDELCCSVLLLLDLLMFVDKCLCVLCECVMVDLGILFIFDVFVCDVGVSVCILVWCFWDELGVSFL